MHVSRPLVALLIGTVVFFALWITALKPSSGPGGGHQALGQYQPAINKACQVPGLQHAEGCGHTATTPTPTTSGKTSAPSQGASTGTGGAHAKAGGSAAAGSSAQHGRSHSAQAAKPSTHAGSAGASASPKAGFAGVQAGLRQHKVLALLFYNPASADDRAVHQELAAVPTHRGAVVKLAVPLQDLSRYSMLLNEVPVNFSPTLVLIDRARQADEITGFADPLEIDKRVAAALGSHS